MPAPTWSYESWSERKQRQLSEFDALAGDGLKAFSASDPLAPSRSAQSADDWGKRAVGDGVEDRAAAVRADIARRAQERMQGPASRALGAVGRVLSELDRPLSERAGIEIPDLPGPVDEIGNFVLREGTRPTNFIMAAVGGPATTGALRGAGVLGRIAATVAEPVVQGGILTRLASEAAVNAGARVIGDAAVEALPEDAPGIVKGAVALGAGAIGGIGAAQGVRAARGLAAAGRRAAANGAVRTGDSAAGRYLVSVEDSKLLPDVRDALEFAARKREADAPSYLARLFYELPGTKKNIRPGLDMPESILEAHIARSDVAANMEQMAFGTRRPILDAVEQSFGPESTAGGRVAVVFNGPQEHLAYPGIGTLKDVFERPSMYELKPEQRAVIDAFHQRNEVERQWAQRFGADIREFTPGDGGAYLPNKDISESVDQWLKNLEGTPATGRLAASSAKTREYATGFDRWKADTEAVARGELKPEQVFKPETNLRVLTETLDAQKARMAGDAVFRSGLGGKTLTEVAEEVAPRLKEARTSVQKQVTAVRGKLNRALISNRVDATAAARLQSQLDSVADRALRVAEVADTPDVRLPEVERLRQTVDNIDASVNELKTFGQDARAIEFGALTDELDALKTEYTEATRYWTPQGNRVSAAEQRRVINGDIGRVRSQIDELLRADRIDESKARAVRTEGRRILGEMRKTVAPLERGVDKANRAVDVADSVRERSSTSLLNRIDRMQDRIETTLGRVGERDATVADLRADLGPLKDRLKELNASYANINPRDYVRVDEVGGRYFPSEEAGHIKRLMQRDAHPIAKAMASLNATVLGGDLSPIVGQQGMIQFLSAPVQTAQMVGSALAKGWEEGDLLRGFRADNLAENIRRDPESWSEFARATGRAFTPGNVPDEFAGGWFRKLPGGVGEKFARFNDAVFSVTVQGQKRMFDETVADLVRSGMDRRQAVATAGQHVMEIIPTPNAAGAGLSPRQAELLRTPVTSLTFIQRPIQTIADTGEAFFKIATGKGGAVTPRQQLAMKASMRMAGTALGLAASTAAVEALRTGGDPVQAALDAVNPDPKNSKFLQMTVGGLRIPLGGPYRALIRAIAPGEVNLDGMEDPIWVPFAGAPIYFANRVAPAARAGLSLARNEDFYGNPIMSSDFPMNILQAAGYVGASALPITAQAPYAAARAGDGVGTAALDMVGGFLGTNVSPKTPTDQLNEIARQRYGKEFYDIEPAQRAAIKEDHGTIWQEAVRRGGQQRQIGEAVRAELRDQQIADDDLLLSGQISREDWKDERDRRRIEVRARLKQIYGDAPISDEAAASDPMLRFTQTIQRATDAATGRVDWELVDALRSEFSDEENTFIDRNTGVGDTPVSRLYREVSREYYGIPQYAGFTADEGRDINEVWQVVRNLAAQSVPPGQRPTETQMAIAYRRLASEADIPERVATGVQRRILGTLTESKARERYKAKTPAAALVVGTGPLTQRDSAAIEMALPG